MTAITSPQAKIAIVVHQLHRGDAQVGHISAQHTVNPVAVVASFA